MMPYGRDDEDRDRNERGRDAGDEYLLMAERLRSTARMLDAVTDRERDVIDRETVSRMLNVTSQLREVAAEIERCRARYLSNRADALLERAEGLIDDGEREIARIECLIDHGRPPFATAECPKCSQLLAVPEIGEIECTICQHQPTRTEVFTQ